VQFIESVTACWYYLLAAAARSQQWPAAAVSTKCWVAIDGVTGMFNHYPVLIVMTKLFDHKMFLYSISFTHFEIFDHDYDYTVNIPKR